MTAGAAMWQEIHEQPEAWTQVLRNTAPFTELYAFSSVIYLGAGVALYIGRSAAACIRALGGPASYALPAQDAYTFPRLVATPHPSLYVMIARTGDVSDAVRAMTVLRSAPGSRVAVIGEEGGPLADLADRVYSVRVAERSVVTTKTITSILLTMQVAGWRAMHHPDLDRATRLPELAARLLPSLDAVAREEASRAWEEIVVLGSGPFYGLAEAGALAIREASLSQAVAHHALVYPHGQKVTISERTLVILFASDSAREEERRVLREARAMGGRTIAVGERAAEIEADVPVEMACGLNEWQRLVLCLPFAQLLGYHRALAKGVDPDRPRHLPKTF